MQLNILFEVLYKRIINKNNAEKKLQELVTSPELQNIYAMWVIKNH